MASILDAVFRQNTWFGNSPSDDPKTNDGYYTRDTAAGNSYGNTAGSLMPQMPAVPPKLQDAYDNYRRIQASQSGLYHGTTDVFNRDYPSVLSSSGRDTMIWSRLHLTNGDKVPFDEMMTSVVGDKVFVFLVVKGQGLVLEDEKVMFPSDSLITNLRLLMS